MTKVDVAPAVLVWARETMGLSRENAAKQVGLSALDLRYLEEGVGNLSIAQLRRMADAYARPMMVFFLNEPPPDDDRLPDFRLLPQNQHQTWSAALHQAFRRVRMQREVALELAELTAEPSPPIDLRLNLGDDPEQAGATIRRWLHAPAAATVASGRPSETLSLWVGLIEDRMILVTQVQGVQLQEMRGFSIGEHPFV